LYKSFGELTSYSEEEEEENEKKEKTTQDKDGKED